MANIIKHIVLYISVFTIGIVLNLSFGTTQSSARVTCEDDACAFSKEFDEWVCRDASAAQQLPGYDCTLNPPGSETECSEQLCDPV